MSEPNEELLRAYTQEILKKKKQGGQGGEKETVTQQRPEERSKGMEGISVDGRPLGRSGLDSMSDVEADSGVVGARKTSVSSVPSELAGFTRGRRETSPERRVEDLQHDEKGWYRIVGGRKIYE